MFALVVEEMHVNLVALFHPHVLVHLGSVQLRARLCLWVLIPKIEKEA